MKIKAISQRKIAQLQATVKDARECHLALSNEDLQLIDELIGTVNYLQERLATQDITVRKLRRLLGMEPSTEKSNRRHGNTTSTTHTSDTQSQTPEKEDTSSAQERTSPPAQNECAATENPSSASQEADEKEPRKTPNHGVIQHYAGKYDYSTDFSPGDPCPLCAPIGKVYPFRCTVLVRITAHDPLEATKHTLEQMRCNSCHAVFTATVPESLTQDGPLTQKYGYSAQVHLVLEKFLSGTPYYHQSFRQALNQMNLAPSSIYDQIAHVARCLEPIEKAIRYATAQSTLFLYDDTSHRIIEQIPEIRPARNGKGERERSGVYCSQVIGYGAGWESAVTDISLGHVGELIDDILRLRVEKSPPALTMSDAASVNRPTVGKTINGLCNSHGRRGFKYAEENFPEQAEQVLQWYKKIWRNETTTKKQKMTLEERRDYHYAHSLPVMEQIRAWSLDYQASENYEEHSALGKAVRYFLKHYPGLILFCLVLGMPLDNNRSEETLKLAIRGRKLYHFFKTAEGARMASIHLTVLLTCIRSGINPKTYLLTVLHHQEAVKHAADQWLPWNYHEALAQIKQEKSAQAA